MTSQVFLQVFHTQVSQHYALIFLVQTMGLLSPVAFVHWIE